MSHEVKQWSLFGIPVLTLVHEVELDEEPEEEPDPGSSLSTAATVGFVRDWLPDYHVPYFRDDEEDE